MAKVYQFMADGFEDIEALAPIDILRRGGVEVVTVSINNNACVQSAHGVTVMADAVFEDCNFSDADLLLLPGGMPGASNLRAHEGVCQAITEQHAKGKRIGAICAAPYILGELGLLQGKRATCYPGFESHLKGATYTAELVTIDGNITTAEGPGAAMPYGYQLLSYFTSPAAIEALKEGMRFNHLMK